MFLYEYMCYTVEVVKWDMMTREGVSVTDAERRGGDLFILCHTHR